MTSVRVDGLPSRFRRSADHLVVLPRIPVSGRFTTTVTYSGVPSEITDADGALVCTTGATLVHRGES